VSWRTEIRDCIALVRRLLGDPRVPRRKKAVLVMLLVYLASPIDLIPDFLPVVGYLDDVVIAALALRYVTRGLDERKNGDRHFSFTT
jgi:uncharacterized membrane protein YkvA (DUF1232 family)